MDRTIRVAIILSVLAYVSLVTAGCAASVSSSADAAPLSSLQIDGIALGMASPQVLTTLKGRGWTAATIKAPCVSDYIAMHKKTVSLSDRSGHCISNISATAASGTLLISFVEDFPARPGVSTVTSISFNQDIGSASPELSETSRQAGAPSITDGNTPWKVAMWCEGFKCDNMDATLRDPNSGMVLLVHRGSGLSLTFDSYAAKRRSAIYDVLAKHHVTITD